MSADKDDTPTGHIIIGASCYSDATLAIEIAVLLAKWSNTDLRGMLVEQDLLHDLGITPASRLVSHGGAMISAPTGRQWHSLMAAEANAFRSAVEQAALDALCDWSFEARTGNLCAQLRDAASAQDVVLMGYSRMYRRGGPVVLLHHPGSKRGAAARIAVKLARDLGVYILVLAVAEDAASRTGVQARLDSMMQAMDVPSSASRVFDTRDELTAWLSRQSVSLVVTDVQDGPFRSDSAILKLSDAARSPLVLVGAVSGARALANTTVFAPAPT